MKKPPETEDHIKDMLRQWFDRHTAWHYAPVQTGFGVHGIHDRVGCIPIVVTPEMVGKTIGLFASVEAKRPGRRKEPRRGMSVHQLENMQMIQNAGGLSICCDGQEDLDWLDESLRLLRGPA